MTYKYGWIPPEKIVKRPALDVRARAALQKVRDGLVDTKLSQSDQGFVRALLTCAEVALDEQKPERCADYALSAAHALFTWGPKLNEVKNLLE